MAENQAEFVVQGFEPGEDEHEIREALDDLTGVMGTEIDPDSGAVTVRFDYDVLSEAKVRDTVGDLGYEIEDRSAE